MWYLYILYSVQLDGYYIGHTGMRPEDRLVKHLTNHKGYTARAKDWCIVHLEQYQNKSEAMQREKFLKALKSKTAIMKLIALPD